MRTISQQQHDQIVNRKWQFHSAGAQLPFLGLSEGRIAELAGKPVLDLACGKGNLVEYLRNKGIEAVGIDPNAPKGHPFMREIISGSGREKGIPAADNSYDAIFTFQNPLINGFYNRSQTEINHAYSSPDWKQQYEQNLRMAESMISEIGRTLKAGGSATIFPGAEHIYRAIDILRTYGLVPRHEQVTLTLRVGEEELGLELQRLRTVLTKRDKK